MTRYLYGGGGDSEVNAPSGLPRASAPAQVYNARVGGTVVTDILDMAGSSLGGTVTTDSFGQAIFQGPDAYTQTLWLDYGTGPRWAVNPKDIDQAHAGGQIITDQRTLDFSGRTFTTKAALPKNTADPLENSLATLLDPIVIPRFASASAMNTAFPSPADGDRCYRTDLHARMQYSSAVTRWCAEPALIYETVLANSTTNSVSTGTIPNCWDNLRVVVMARGASSSQTHKWGIEIFAQINGDATAASYMDMGWSSLDKIVSGTTTYGISTIDASGGSTTASAPILLTRNSFAGDLGARMGFIPGESTPANMWGSVETVIPTYNSPVGTHASGMMSRHSAANVSSPTSYALEGEYKSNYANYPVTSLTVALFTGAFFQAQSVVRVYGY